MAQGLRAPAPLPEDPESIPSTHTAAESCLLLQLQGTRHSLLAFMGMRDTDIRAGNTPTQVRKQERKPRTLKGGRGVCTDREQLFWSEESSPQGGRWRECGWERGHEVTRSQTGVYGPQNRGSPLQSLSGLAMRSLTLWPVWDSAGPQAVASSLQKDS